MGNIDLPARQVQGPAELAFRFLFQTEPGGEAPGKGHGIRVSAPLQFHLYLGKGQLLPAADQHPFVQGQLDLPLPGR